MDKTNQLQKQILSWYDKNKRFFPWRHDQNPYRIWISEIMLQQTRADKVVTYYSAFIKKFPSIQHLCFAKQDDILKCWEGLGYYQRALNLQKTAILICQKFSGNFPTNYYDILSLPGIGPYTAGAIASICFNQKFPAIDGNVKRVISRLYLITDEIDQPVAFKKITDVLNILIPASNPGCFNQALMDIGSTLCLPKKPKCFQCPLNAFCKALEHQKQKEIPKRKRKKKQRIQYVEVGILTGSENIFLEKRPEKGLLAKMWGLPVHVNQKKISDGHSLFNQLQKQLNIPIYLHPTIISHFSYAFTHEIWEISLFLYLTPEKIITFENPFLRWIPKKDLKDLPIPEVFQKCLKEYSSCSLV